MPKRPTLALTRDEAVTVHFAIKAAVYDCQNEIRNRTREHGPAESAMFLSDLHPLAAKIEQWLTDNPR